MPAESTIEGIVILAQESRFTLIDDQGVAHLFVLSSNAPLEPEEATALANGQARLRVHYRDADGLIARTALDLVVLDQRRDHPDGRASPGA
jgi:hypothetical protein